MWTLPLLLAIFFAPSSAIAGAADFSVFYCIHAERPCEETSREAPLGRADAMALARRTLATNDDFIGFVDASDTTVQFYVEGDDTILVDLPVPARKGSYATRLTREQALRLIAGLSPPFSRYPAELRMTFSSWK